MFCEKCGTKLNENDLFCSNCGNKIERNNISQVTNINSNQIEDDKKANLLCTISLILGFGSGMIYAILSSIFKELEPFFSSIYSLCPLASLVFMIIARVKYPNNKFAKVLMWIYIILTILGIIAFIVFAVACFIMCNSINTSGCN